MSSTTFARFARSRPMPEGRARTKIVATIGPSSEDRIDELLDAGMDVARINFSHGTHDDHRRRVGALREAAARKGMVLGILADIRGPKVRLGRFPTGTLELQKGAVVRVVECEDGAMATAPSEIPVAVPGLLEALRTGHRLFLADGAVEIEADKKTGEGFLAVVRRAGIIADKKGVHLPDTDLHMEIPTAEDLVDLELARELDMDFVGVSFVSHAEELTAVRSALPDALVVAKIERALALENLDELLSAADGIMVARGDLGVEMALEQVPMIQKALCQAALRAGKFTITATEMLESMVTSSRPTRAEVTDVANAVLDGSDAVMLSAETAVGKNPPAVVVAMDRIARAAESSPGYHDLSRVAFRASEPTFSNAVCLAAAQAADALELEHIICFTETGNTPRQLSRYRPQAEVFALSPHPRTLRRMSVLAHVRPIDFPHSPSLEDMLDRASTLLLERGLVRRGERVVFVAGVPPGVARSTNVLKLHRIGDPIKLT